MGRGHFSLLFSTGVVALILATPVAWAVTFTHGVASGDVTSDSVILWTRVGQTATVTAEISLDETFSTIVTSAGATATADDDFTVKVDIGGLQPDTPYFYRFRDGASTSVTGTFRTAPAPQTLASVVFAWSSDSDGSEVFNQFQVFDQARQDDINFWVYLGDTAYMDSNEPRGEDLPSMRAKYKQNREDPFLALPELLRSTSTYAIWDDHEVKDDFDGQTVNPILLADGREAFLEYMPLRDALGLPGFFRRFRWGKHVELFILDERSFRSPKVQAICQNDLAPTLPASARLQLGLPPAPPPGCRRALKDPTRTMLGSLQKILLFSGLLESDATWKFIVNEVPISELFILPYDRWEGYAAERKEILDFIRASKMKNVLFLTGDLHGNVATDVRFSLFTNATPVTKEFIAGPIAQVPLFLSLVETVGSAEAANALVGFLVSLTPPDCIDLNKFAYGLVEVDGPTGNLKVTLRDDAGLSLCSIALTPPAGVP